MSTTMTSATTAAGRCISLRQARLRGLSMVKPSGVPSTAAIGSEVALITEASG